MIFIIVCISCNSKKCFDPTDVRGKHEDREGILVVINSIKFHWNHFTCFMTVMCSISEQKQEVQRWVRGIKCLALFAKIVFYQHSFKIGLLCFVSADFNGTARILWSWDRQFKVGRNIYIWFILSKLCFCGAFLHAFLCAHVLNQPFSCSFAFSFLN